MLIYTHFFLAVDVTLGAKEMHEDTSRPISFNIYHYELLFGPP